jgi:membrane-bound inhibitor of C-type lysozyme
MIRRRLIAALVLLAPFALAACNRPPEGKAVRPGPAAPGPDPISTPPPIDAHGAPTLVYACANGEVLRAAYPDGATAIVDYRGRMRTLRLSASANGARYVGDGLQWWTKGQSEGQVSSLGVGQTMAAGESIACTIQGQGPAADATPPGPGQPGGLADDGTPVSEAPFTTDSPQGAANVVQTYYALIEQRKYAEAWRLWEDRGRGSNLGQADFAATFAPYAEYHANIGAPGQSEGAAGSVYVTVPVQAYGQRKAGGAFNLRGQVTLRRVNDVPGSTPEQRKWRIRSIDLKPTG